MRDTAHDHTTVPLITGPGLGKMELRDHSPAFVFDFGQDFRQISCVTLPTHTTYPHTPNPFFLVL